MSQPGLKVDWEDLAWEHGFQGDDEEMLDYYYNAEELTLVQIGMKLGLASTTVGKRMKELGIKIVPKKAPEGRRGPRLPKRGV